MRLSLFALSVTALLLNVGWFVIFEPEPSDDNNDTGNDTPDGEEEQISDLEALTVPKMRINDQAIYDYDLFAELYWENYTSGEWEKYTFTGEGEFIEYVAELTTAEDGFGATRRAAKFGYETKASFKVRIQRNPEDGEATDIVIPGSLDVERTEFENLYDKHALKALNAGSISIEGLGQLNPKFANIEYIADLKSYPDPNLEPYLTIDESIYGNDRPMRLSSRGAYEGSPLEGEEERVFNWSVTGAYKVQDYETFRINVTSSFYNFFDFKRVFYISGDSPFPIKGSTRTNSTYEDEDGIFYIIVETDRELKKDGLSRGENLIPWGDLSGHKEYDQLHPAGEFMGWEYGPEDGTDLERSSFAGLSFQQSMDYALENSEELQAFITEMEAQGNVLIEDSTYNITTETNLGNDNRTQFWNLTFSKAYDMDEMYDYYQDNEEWPEWKYTIQIARSVEETRNGEKISIFIAGDEGRDGYGRRRVRWDNGIVKDQLTLNSRILTITHGEKILKTDQRVKETAYEDNVIKEDVLFYYGIVGISEQSTPGLALIQQLTGVTTPTANNAIGFRQNNVFEEGTMFSSAVDANTGQLLYVISVEGDELASFFG